MKILAGTEYRAKDKIVSKMTREGLTEENIREGSVKEISQRSRGHPAEREKRYAPLRHSNDDRRLRNATSRINTAFFAFKNK